MCVFVCVYMCIYVCVHVYKYIPGMPGDTSAAPHSAPPRIAARKPASERSSWPLCCAYVFAQTLIVCVFLCVYKCVCVCVCVCL